MAKFEPTEEAVMHTMLVSTALALLFASGSCNAQTVLKAEPMMMNRGAVVLVDDGTCPKGQLKQISTVLATGVVTAPYGAVTKKCIQAASTKQ
jgi:hypothetical protein